MSTRQFGDCISVHTTSFSSGLATWQCYCISKINILIKNSLTAFRWEECLRSANSPLWCWSSFCRARGYVIATSIFCTFLISWRLLLWAGRGQWLIAWLCKSTQTFQLRFHGNELDFAWATSIMRQRVFLRYFWYFYEPAHSESQVTFSHLWTKQENTVWAFHYWWTDLALCAIVCNVARMVHVHAVGLTLHARTKY